MIPSIDELQIDLVGLARMDSPLRAIRADFIEDSQRVLVAKTPDELKQGLGGDISFERAGPRRVIHFDPSKTTAALVTCGGLCPGLNEVIRSITLTLIENYGVAKVVGYRYGLKGLLPGGLDPLQLTTDLVGKIGGVAGTILGTSRGPQDVAQVLETLRRDAVNILFVIGGDGTHRAAFEISQQAKLRGQELSVIGIPKTIDNDILWTDLSFGFYTAVEEAKKVIHVAHAEARGAYCGIGLVKLMGRHSGFIAAHACRAAGVANFCLIPEVPFSLEGEGGFLKLLETRLRQKQHAVIVVSEGAGQHLFETASCPGFDASGNRRLHDIGLFLRDKIIQYLKGANLSATLKYIDPSYIIRSAPADTYDSELCLMFGSSAAHAAMAGRTNITIGLWNREFVHIPIPLVVKSNKYIDPAGELWQSVVQITQH